MCYWILRNKSIKPFAFKDCIEKENSLKIRGRCCEYVKKRNI